MRKRDHVARSEGKKYELLPRQGEERFEFNDSDSGREERIRKGSNAILDCYEMRWGWDSKVGERSAVLIEISPECLTKEVNRPSRKQDFGGSEEPREIV